MPVVFKLYDNTYILVISGFFTWFLLMSYKFGNRDKFQKMKERPDSNSHADFLNSSFGRTV